MDLYVGLLCVAVAMLSAIVIYVISMSTMKEQTYDEAMADRRKKTEEQFSQGQMAKEKIKDKKDKKKAGKKVKEKNIANYKENAVEVDGGVSKNHVAFVEPEVIDEKSVKERKRWNKKKDKPILLNKNEHNVVVSTRQPLVQNQFEKILPKDDFELKRSHSREEMKLPSELTNAAPAAIAAKEHPQGQSKRQASKVPNNVGESKVDKAQSQQVKQQNQPKQQRPQQQHKQQNQTNQVEAGEKAPVGFSANNLPGINGSGSSDRKESGVKLTAAVAQQQSASSSSSQSTPSHQSTSSPSIKLSKKQKTELAHLNQISGDHREVININLLLPLVGKAELSKSEVQRLIDLLLNKQQGIADGSAEWIEGRQDPVVKLKKQLAEKEKALTDEVDASIGFQTRLKEIRAELNAEKHNNRTLEEALHTRQAEIASVAVKLQHVVEEKQAIGQQLQQVQSKLNEERLLVRKLQEDGAQAQTSLQQELLGQRQQLEIHIARLSETQLQQQETIASLEAQLNDRMQTSEALTNEIAMLRESTAHLQEAAAQAQEQAGELMAIRNNMDHVVAAGKFETARLQKEIKELSEQNNHMRNENEKLNGAIQNVQTENSRLREANERLSAQASSACVEARQLRDENETLAAQVTASMERPAIEGRENGDLNNYSEGKLSHTQNKDDIQSKELLIEELSNKLKLKDVELEKLTRAMKTAEVDMRQQDGFIGKLEKEVTYLRQETERLSKELLQQKTHVSQLIEQLDSQQAKNNDLRTKNWKVMEALSTTEKLLQNKITESDRLVTEAVKSAAEKSLIAQQSSTTQLLQRVFPELVIPQCKGHLEWYEEVEKALKKWKPLETNVSESGTFTELEKQNGQLQAMVTHYKNIIADTEGMLNRLQSHVEQEEGKWAEELQSLRTQLEAVTRQRDELQDGSEDDSA